MPYNLRRQWLFVSVKYYNKKRCLVKGIKSELHKHEFEENCDKHKEIYVIC